MPRDSNGRAIIPEARNDENLIIVQLHKAVARFHNRIVDHARAQGIRREWVFETARRLTRWHYQWAVIHDFLRDSSATSSSVRPARSTGRSPGSRRSSP